jgi:hypothetical protein
LLNVITGQLGGGAPAVTNSYESIATVTVGAGGQSSVTFSSIPSTYKHLQLRCSLKTSRTSSNLSSTPITFNGDTGTNYTSHDIEGNGSSASASAATSQPAIDVGRVAGNNSAANIFGFEIIDILDYANTNKYKTLRMLNGYDANGSGVVALCSGLWLNTAAISSITFGTPYDATGYLQYSSFALYGIKG